MADFHRPQPLALDNIMTDYQKQKKFDRLSRRLGKLKPILALTYP